jgi:predicted phage terminase large subunit-like protein
LNENTVLLRDKTVEIARYLQSFGLFLREVLGYKADPSINYFDLVETHQELIDFLQEEGKAKLVLMPRESMKSQIATVGYALWRLCRDPNMRVLIYSDTITKASGFLLTLKNHIEGKAPNSRFREIFGAWETDPHNGGLYNDSSILISKRTHQSDAPSVDTCGIEQSKVGKHYDLIIYDDIVTDLNVTTKAQMDKVYECYTKSLSILRRGGDVVMVGTRWSYGDLYGRLAKRNEETKEFKIFTRDAMQERDGKLIFEDIGMTREWLNKQLEKQGSYLFSALYRNNPASDDASLFKFDYFTYYQPSDGFHKNFFITGTCDPAGEGEDYTAITVVGHDNKKNMYVLDAVNKHMSVKETCETIIRLNYKWGFDRFAVEKNFLKGALERDFREAEKSHTSNSHYKQFSLKESIVTSKTNQTFTKVLGLQPLHERGSLLLPGKDFYTLISPAITELAYQMMQYTTDGCKAAHDDLIVSLAFHLEIASVGGVAEKEKAPYTSAKWFEENILEVLSLRGSRTPRRYRQEYQPIFN